MVSDAALVVGQLRGTRGLFGLRLGRILSESDLAPHESDEEKQEGPYDERFLDRLIQHAFT